MRGFAWGAILVLAVGGMALLPKTAGAQYLAAKRCRPCHLAQFKSWQQTRMAKAFELLKPGVSADAKRAHNLDPDKDYTSDPNCVSCHVTGYGQPGGFVSLEKTPTLAGVQCDACHGPGKAYLKPNLMSLKNKAYKRNDLVAAGMVIPSAETCQSCHNEKSPFYQAFDYEARVGQGTHVHKPLKYKHD
ncbi:MAG: cytochrome c family protein [Terriglobia bacterium]